MFFSFVPAWLSVCGVLRRLHLCIVFVGVTMGCFLDDALLYAEVKSVAVFPNFQYFGAVVMFLGLVSAWFWLFDALCKPWLFSG
jgi:hypothetical protein